MVEKESQCKKQQSLALVKTISKPSSSHNPISTSLQKLNKMFDIKLGVETNNFAPNIFFTTKNDSTQIFQESNNELKNKNLIKDLKNQWLQISCEIIGEKHEYPSVYVYCKSNIEKLIEPILLKNFFEKSIEAAKAIQKFGNEYQKQEALSMLQEAYDVAELTQHQEIVNYIKKNFILQQSIIIDYKADDIEISDDFAIENQMRINIPPLIDFSMPKNLKENDSIFFQVSESDEESKYKETWDNDAINEQRKLLLFYEQQCDRQKNSLDANNSSLPLPMPIDLDDPLVQHIMGGDYVKEDLDSFNIPF